MIRTGWSYDAHVPNRTIYVSDDDQPLYQRAQELAGGNLSGAISSALKRYVEAEDARQAGFDEVTVKVGFGAGRKVSFNAVLLGENTEYFEMRDAEGNPLTGWRAWTGIGMAAGGGKPAEATLDTFDTLDELRDRIPAELFDTVSASVRQPGVQDLDI